MGAGIVTDMAFPTSDMQAAFSDFLTAGAILRYIETQRPDLAGRIRYTDGQPMIGLQFPDGKQVVAAKMCIGVMNAWACMTPICSEEDARETMGLSGQQLAAFMIECYDQLAPAYELPESN